MTFEERLDAMELEIRKPIFRKNRGRANEVNYWVFDYPPEKELEVRARIERMQQKNATGNDDFKLVVFDLYDYIIDTLEKERKDVRSMQRITALYEFVARFRRWVSNDPYKCCRGCCVTCPYYKDCEADAQKR